ncbi:MAG TPA: heparan-alpha-glucosaminide N-acetyltransferase domain-containing protein [Bryobacteraceae bacterium]|jgi:predicted acyltransferase|nr:heparan-alpha-glucosaminide N-acetyltransferase domain-containing protein [Bryobacteraceae bacterium]
MAGQVSAATAPVERAEPGAGARLQSLDAFRGATIALMVLVNTPGDYRHVYPPLEHAEWHGWTITDVVFPSFLWIVGVSLTLSLAKRTAAGTPRRKLFAQIARRAAILYALGLFIYAFPAFDIHTFRILGVLQRIAICYFAAAAISLTGGLRGQIAWIIGLLTVYWAAMMLIPAPGIGAGRLEMNRNLANYVDRVVLGRHNYAATRTWDPEGIVSTLPAIATTMLGVMAGYITRSRRPLSERAAWLFLIGNALIVLGLICDHWLPINKKLWTTSFCIFMAGLDFALFAAFLWVVDGQGYRRVVQPFVIFGTNAITIYLCSEMLDEILSAIRWGAGAGAISLRRWIYETIFAPLASPVNASLLYATAYVALMFGIACIMHRRGWIVKV